MSNLSQFVTEEWDDIRNKPTEFTPVAHNHAAADITSGTLSTLRIPDLSASKITSGEFSELRIPAASSTIKGGVRVWKSGTTGYIYTSN